VTGGPVVAGRSPDILGGMTATPPPLLSLTVEPRARLVLFDIADDPVYAAMEVQVFDDPVQGHGVLVLLGRRDGRVEVYRQPGLRLTERRFAVGRGIERWAEAVIEPARVEIHPDGVVVDVALEDAQGRRIEVRIDDRDGVPRNRSTLLAPVSSGVEQPEQLLVVLLGQFDLGRTGGTQPVLRIDGVPRTITPFPGPSRVHRRRFIRYAAAPVIATVNEAHDGPVDPASLGPVARLDATVAGERAALRFVPPVPDLAAIADGASSMGAWFLDVAGEPELLEGTWDAARTGDHVRLAMAVTRPWQPRGLPASLRLVTSVAKVFREWPLTYRWTAEVELGATPTARTAWTRMTGPDRANAYAVPRVPVRRAVGVVALAAAIALVGWRLVAATARR
jgi:hypothetical protein